MSVCLCLVSVCLCLSYICELSVCISHSDDHTRQTDTPGFKPFTLPVYVTFRSVCLLFFCCLCLLLLLSAVLVCMCVCVCVCVCMFWLAMCVCLTVYTPAAVFHCLSIGSYSHFWRIPFISNFTLNFSLITSYV